MKTKEVIKILEENELTNVVKKIKPKIIHTKTFSCANDHPIVFYAFDENNEAVCEYCYDKFVYEPEDPVKKEKELLAMSMKESIGQKEERTHSEEMQNQLEPILDDGEDYRYSDFRDEIADVEKVNKRK